MIPALWTYNVINQEDEKRSFEEYLGNNQRLLTRLKDIIEDKEKALDRTSLSLSSYEDSSWPYKQAHVNGRMAALEEIKQLLDIQG